jgi:glycosyltransferase involved in cell wall biosynthesis
MAAGIPVVASDIPSIRELITDGVHGRLVRPGRPSELARAIRVLLEYPSEILRLGKNARERIRLEYTWEHSTDKLKQFYRALQSVHHPQQGDWYEPHSGVSNVQDT